MVKNAKKLHQKKYRKSTYLIEGWHLFEETVQAGVTIEKIFALESYRDQLSAFPQIVWVSEEILRDWQIRKHLKALSQLFKKKKWDRLILVRVSFYF